jgi:Arc/MetJ family transcription regulator
MRTTVTIDDDLLARAKDVTGIEETGALLRQALKELLHAEASRHLAALGGTMPDLEYIPQFRQVPEQE